MSGVLERLKEIDNPIRVGIIGMGSMGKGLFHQCLVTPGIECVCVADIKIEKALSALKSLGREHRVAGSPEAVDGAVRKGTVAVCDDGLCVTRCDSVDVVIESSNAIGPAAAFALSAIEGRKHLVLMNAEIDLVFGPYLMSLARKKGVVYTSCDGDQHGVIKRLVDEIRLWGFKLVMAGNIKGFLDRTSNPTSIIAEADKRNLDYRMAAAYTDGTKLNIEMALLANGLCLSAAVPGMLGPRAHHVRDVFRIYDFDVLWNEEKPVVDYILGAEPDGGVFVVGYCDTEYQRQMLSYYKMGTGPFYLFYRPYHLCHIEAMTSVAEAFLDGRSLLRPTFGFRTNVIAYAKRDLRKGELLDGIGGYACYGIIENCADGGDSEGLPICLAEGLPLKRDISGNERISLSDVSYDARSFEFDLYAKAVEYSGSELR